MLRLLRRVWLWIKIAYCHTKGVDYNMFEFANVQDHCRVMLKNNSVCQKYFSISMFMQLLAF